MAYPVKMFSSSDVGAPVLSGTPGALLALIEACLLTGYNVKTVDSLTWAEGVATASIGGGHGYFVGDIVTHAGCDNPAFNGEFEVLSATATTYTIGVAGTGLPATVGGAKTARRAPVGGWSKIYSATNKAVWRSDDAKGNRLFLRINDADARSARVFGYETMTGVDDGQGMFPTAAQLPSGLTWWKSTAADSSARSWLLVADSRAFYLFTKPDASVQVGYSFYAFGDIQPLLAVDPYAVMLLGQEASAPTRADEGTAGTTAVVSAENSAVAGRYLARSYHRVGGALRFALFGSGVMSTLGGGDGATRAGFPFPNPADGSLLLSRVYVVETDTVRGCLPGACQPLHLRPLTHGDAIAATIDGQNRRVVMATLQGSGVGGNYLGRLALDVTGPWR